MVRRMSGRKYENSEYLATSSFIWSSLSERTAPLRMTVCPYIIKTCMENDNKQKTFSETELSQCLNFGSNSASVKKVEGKGSREDSSSFAILMELTKTV